MPDFRNWMQDKEAVKRGQSRTNGTAKEHWNRLTPNCAKNASTVWALPILLAWYGSLG